MIFHWKVPDSLVSCEELQKAFSMQLRKNRGLQKACYCWVLPSLVLYHTEWPPERVGKTITSF